MNQETIKQAKLGSFVLVGLILFITVLALVGRQQNVFERTFRLQVRVSNVQGLQKGSNVWFSGVKIGIVKDVVIESTQSVLLELKVGRTLQSFIKKDASAKIGSDGLLGNKIVIISGGTEEAAAVEDGDMIDASQGGINTDELMATFQVTNDNLAAITSDLKTIFADIQGGKGSLGGILQDSVMYGDLKATIASATAASRNTAKATQGLTQLVGRVNAGEGMVGAILNDSSYEGRVDRALIDVSKTADEAAKTAEQLNKLTKDLQVIMAGLDDPNAPMGMMLKDSVFANNLQESMMNLKNSSDELDKTLEAARESFLMRKRIFKKNKPE
ncbi:MAG: MlaD family protein [Bacteroidia bacterium]